MKFSVSKQLDYCFVSHHHLKITFLVHSDEEIPNILIDQPVFIRMPLSSSNRTYVITVNITGIRIRRKILSVSTNGATPSTAEFSSNSVNLTIPSNASVTLDVA